MKSKRTSSLSVKNNTTMKNHFHFRGASFYWIVPLLFLAVALCVVVIFNYGSKDDTSDTAVLAPARIINIQQDFSAKFYFNNTFGNADFSKAIIKAIDESKKSVEVAVYSMNHTAIRDALYRAAKRGVSVTLIFSDRKITQHNKLFVNMPREIRRIDIASNSAASSGSLMHHKFILVDRGVKSQRLFFGSYNFTELQEKYDPSFLMETTRPELVDIFGEEFTRLTEGAHGHIKFKNNFNPFAALIKYPQGDLEIWFSPQSYRGGLRNRLLSLIRGAQKSINILVWDITDKEIARALVLAAHTKPVEMLVDDVNFSTQGSVAPFIESEKKFRGLDKLNILTDVRRNEELAKDFNMKDFNSFLHHHLLLVDDTIAVFGTSNWSTNGFYNNDESTMVTTIPSIVKSFKETFDVNYNKAK